MTTIRVACVYCGESTTQIVLIDGVGADEVVEVTCSHCTERIEESWDGSGEDVENPELIERDIGGATT